MNFVTLAALGIALAGAEGNSWTLCLLVLGVAACVHFLVPQRQTIPSLDRWTMFAAAALLALAALQLAPLPASLVGVLSPARVELLRATSPVMHGSREFVTLSAVPYLSALQFLNLAGYGLVFIVARELTLRLRDWTHFQNATWSIAWPLLVIAGLEAVLGIFQASTRAGEPVSGTYANSDHFAGLLEMVFPFAVLYPAALLQRERKRYESPAGPALKACIVLAVAVTIAGGVLYSLSDIGLLAACAGLLIGVGCALSMRGWSVEYKVAAPWWRQLLPVAIAGGIVLGLVYLPGERVVKRFSDLAATQEVPAATQAQIWRDTKALIKAYPLFGCGLGGYESCFMRYKSVAPAVTVDYAHNDYLQVLAELGAFGMAAGVLFIGRLLWLAMRGALYARSIDERYLAIACAASMMAMLLHSVVDFDMYVPANAMVFAWVAGIAGAYANREQAKTRTEEHALSASAGA